MQILAMISMIVAFLFFVANLELIVSPIGWLFQTILDFLKIGD